MFITGVSCLISPVFGLCTILVRRSDGGGPRTFARTFPGTFSARARGARGAEASPRERAIRYSCLFVHSSVALVRLFPVFPFSLAAAAALYVPPSSSALGPA